MSHVSLIRSRHLRHADYADAAIIGADKEVIFLAGACPLDDQGVVVAANDVAAQTRKALQNLEAALTSCFATLHDVAFLRILVATHDREELAAAWAAVRSHFGANDVPATLQGVTVLGYRNQLVEIEAVAARDPR